MSSLLRELAIVEKNLPTAKSCLPFGIPEEFPNTTLPWMAMD